MFQKVQLKKEYFLIAGMFLLVFICYKYPVKKTLELYKLNGTLKANLEASTDLTFQPEYLQRKKRNMDKILSRYQLDSLSFRVNAIAEISYIAEKVNVKLIEIPPPDPFYNSNEFLIQRLDFQGDYFSILKIIEKLQNQENIGVLRSLNLKALTRRNQSTKVLMLEIYLQIEK